GVVSVAFFLSVVAEAPLPAVAAAFALVIVSQVLDSLTALGAVRNLLPTHYWGAWEDLFAGSVTVDDMVAGVLLQLLYAIVFLALAWWWFGRKDILPGRRPRGYGGEGVRPPRALRRGVIA